MARFLDIGYENWRDGSGIAAEPGGTRVTGVAGFSKGGRCPKYPAMKLTAPPPGYHWQPGPVDANGCPGPAILMADDPSKISGGSGTTGDGSSGVGGIGSGNSGNTNNGSGNLAGPQKTKGSVDLLHYVVPAAAAALLFFHKTALGHKIIATVAKSFA